MNMYLSVIKLRLINAMQYRAAAWAGIFAQILWGFLRLFILYAFYRSSSSPEPMSVGQTADYVWLGQAFWMMTQMGIQDEELLKSITSGNVSYELCRPCGLYPMWFARLLAVRLSYVALRTLPIMAVAFIVPEPYRLHPPVSVSAFMVFIAAMAVSLFIAVACSMFIYYLTFLTLSSSGPRQIIGAAADFFMGMVIPIPLMPDAVQKTVNFLPFRYMTDMPFRLYSGSIGGSDVLYGVALQIFWAAALIALGSLCFRSVRSKIIVQGG